MRFTLARSTSLQLLALSSTAVLIYIYAPALLSDGPRSALRRPVR